MRYLVAAALAVVLVLPPANVGAGPVVIPPDSFLIIGGNADLSEQEFIFCGSLEEPNVWLLATTDAGAIDLVYIGSDAKVSGKGGVRMKQKAKSANGDIRLFDFPPAPAPATRSRGPAPVETDVAGSMSASYNPKTLTLAARMVDKTNGTTAELTSAVAIYVISNFTVIGPDGCQGLIDSIEESGALPPSVRGLTRQ